MRKQLQLFLIAAIGLAMLPGCVKSYKPIELEPLEDKPAQVSENKDLTVHSKIFTKDDCCALFGDRAKRITSGGRKSIVPIQLTIQNNSNTELLLTKDDIDLPLVNLKSVASKLGNRATPFTNFALFGTLGFAAVVATIATTGVGAFAILLVPATLETGIGGGFLATAGQAACNWGVNNQIVGDLQHKALYKQLKIAAHSSATTLIFVKKKDVQDTFAIKFRNTEQKPTIEINV